MFDRRSAPERRFSANSFRFKVGNLRWHSLLLLTPILSGGNHDKVCETPIRHRPRRLLCSRQHDALGGGRAEEELDSTSPEDLRAEAVRRDDGKAPRAPQRHLARRSAWTG